MSVVVASVMVEPLGWMIVHSIWLLLLPFVALVIGLRLVPEQWSRTRYAAALGTLCFMVLLPFAVLPWIEQTEDSVLAASVEQLSIDAQEPREFSTDVSVDEIGFSPNEDLLPEASEAAVIGLSDSAPEGRGSNPGLVDDAKVPATSSPSVALFLTQRIRPLLPWAVGVWFAGALMMTFRLLLGWRATVRLKQSGSHAVSTVVQEMFDELKQRMGVPAAVRVLQSTLVRVPSVVGHFQPVVLLPVAAITGLSPDQLRAILAHETSTHPQVRLRRQHSANRHRNSTLLSSSRLVGVTHCARRARKLLR